MFRAHPSAFRARSCQADTLRLPTQLVKVEEVQRLLAASRLVPAGLLSLLVTALLSLRGLVGVLRVRAAIRREEHGVVRLAEQSDSSREKSVAL